MVCLLVFFRFSWPGPGHLGAWLSFFVIARNPQERVWRKVMEILPFNLPDLLKPPGPAKTIEKPTF